MAVFIDFEYSRNVEKLLRFSAAWLRAAELYIIPLVLDNNALLGLSGHSAERV
jgi:hypothetical protein